MRLRDFKASIALIALLGGAPLAAQSTPPATATPAPRPAPTDNAVGPPQLRDFNLNGTVTQPAQNPPPAQTPPAQTPTPTPAPRASNPATTTPAPRRATAAPVTVTPAERLPTLAAPDRNPSPDAVTVDLPPPSAGPIAVEPSLALGPTQDGPLPAAERGIAWWPWLAALLVVALGGAFLWWRRQQQGWQRYAADSADLSALVAVPDAAPAPLPRAATPTPRPPAPVPGKATTPARPVPRQPVPATTPVPAAAPAPVPTPDATPAPVPTAPVAPIGIVASGLKPRIEIELVPIRAETDDKEGAALTFDIIVINRGSAPARDVLIEARLINAGPQVDAEVGRFFTQRAGTGERLPVIAPMARVSIRTRLAVSAADLSPLVVEGRKLLVPVVAINALYRWSGGELTDSSSYLVGRGEAEGGKMAPFRLDRGARSWSGLGVRLHSSGLQRA